MAFYDRMQKMVLRMLKKYGRTITLVKRVGGTYSATTHTVTGETEPTYSVLAVFLPQQEKFIDGKHYEWNDQFHSGTEIHVNQSGLFISPLMSDGTLAPAPEAGDAVQIDGKQYEITISDPLNPAGTPVLYQVTIRK